jgi:hypothetical protein
MFASEPTSCDWMLLFTTSEAVFTCTRPRDKGRVLTLQPGFMAGNENRESLIRVNTSSGETLLSKIGLKIICRFPFILEP